MNKSVGSIIGFLVIIIGAILIAFGYFFLQTTVLFIGILVVILGAFFIMITQSVLLFVNDKKLDIESLRNKGLTIVTCSHCQKENVLEDKYCIYCGEELGGSDEKNI
jgi:cadmium resistance protein CadD (predicted permease)